VEAALLVAGRLAMVVHGDLTDGRAAVCLVHAHQRALRHVVDRSNGRLRLARMQPLLVELLLKLLELCCVDRLELAAASASGGGGRREGRRVLVMRAGRAVAARHAAILARLTIV